jgi:hypothetical protein
VVCLVHSHLYFRSENKDEAASSGGNTNSTFRFAAVTSQINVCLSFVCLVANGRPDREGFVVRSIQGLAGEFFPSTKVTSRQKRVVAGRWMNMSLCTVNPVGKYSDLSDCTSEDEAVLRNTEDRRDRLPDSDPLGSRQKYSSRSYQ